MLRGRRRNLHIVGEPDRLVRDGLARGLQDVAAPRLALLDQLATAETGPSLALLTLDPRGEADIAVDASARQRLVGVRDVGLGRSHHPAARRGREDLLLRGRLVLVLVADGARPLGQEGILALLLRLPSLV